MAESSFNDKMQQLKANAPCCFGRLAADLQEILGDTLLEMTLPPSERELDDFALAQFADGRVKVALAEFIASPNEHGLD